MHIVYSKVIRPGQPSSSWRCKWVDFTWKWKTSRVCGGVACSKCRSRPPLPCSDGTFCSEWLICLVYDAQCPIGMCAISQRWSHSMCFHSTSKQWKLKHLASRRLTMCSLSPVQQIPTVKATSRWMMRGTLKCVHLCYTNKLKSFVNQFLFINQHQVVLCVYCISADKPLPVFCLFVSCSVRFLRGKGMKPITNSLRLNKASKP